MTSMNIYELINQIELRPEMYVGDRKLTSIAFYLEGFDMGWHFANGEKISPPWGHEFHVWVRAKLFKDTDGYGYQNSILQKCIEDEGKAFKLFFKLVKQYQKEFKEK